MKKRFSSVKIFFFVLLSVIGILIIAPAHQGKASGLSQESENTYLSVNSKYLYLGVPGKNKYDFDVNSDLLDSVKTCSWYIVEDKGNSKAVKINTKTGAVMAKEVGTAYIGCKITLNDGTVLIGESKIVVINNITEIEISNIPINGTVNTGTTIDFHQKIINTTAGKNIKSSGIVRWEIADDTAGAEAATEEGVVAPKNAGKFSIRAVCFQQIQDYEMWLVDKEVNKDKITAASDWITINVLATEGVVKTQEELDTLLKSDSINKITIAAETKDKLTIPGGDYSDITLIVNSQQTDIVNKGVFKQILINAVNNVTWEENAVNNNMEIYDSIINLVIADKAQVKSIIFNKAEANAMAANKIAMTVNSNDESLVNNFTTDKETKAYNFAVVTVNGMLGELDIKTVSTIHIKGTGTCNKVIVESPADDTKLAVSTAVDLKSQADLTFAILKGAEDTSIQIDPYVTARMENLADRSISVVFDISNYALLVKHTSFIIQSDASIDPTGTAVTSTVVKLEPAPYSAISVTASPIAKGQILMFSDLFGVMYCNYIEIAGSFSWVNPDVVLNTDGYYRWKFTPKDTDHYRVAYGYSRVKIVS